MAKDKMSFKINVREIDFGFIASIENQYHVDVGERHCEDKSSLLGHIQEWVDMMFKKQKEKS